MNEQRFRFNNHDVALEIRDEADESVAAEIFKIREYRIAEDFIINSKLPVIDVGAHAGFFSIYVRLLNPATRIIAVEPEENNVEALKTNLNKNHITGVELIEGALAGKNGKRKLFISNGSHNHQLLENNDQGGEEVNAYALSDLRKKCIMNQIGLIKLDVEGAEFEIIASFSEEDFKNIGAIVMEYHNTAQRDFKTIEKRLRENGFGVQVFPSKFDKSMGFLYAVNKRF